MLRERSWFATAKVTDHGYVRVELLRQNTKYKIYFLDHVLNPKRDQRLGVHHATTASAATLEYTH